MLSLSPAKILVILVVALIVLGPDKLPQVARQMGSLWHDIRQWRSRIESEVRGTFPNLPPTDEVARVVRSPLSFLDRLADEHERTLAQADAPASAAPGPGPAPPGEVSAGQSTAGDATTANGASPVGNGAAPSGNGAAPAGAGAAPSGNGAVPHPLVSEHDPPVAGAGMAGFDDPSMN